LCLTHLIQPLTSLPVVVFLPFSQLLPLHFSPFYILHPRESLCLAFVFVFLVRPVAPVTFFNMFDVFSCPWLPDRLFPFPVRTRVFPGPLYRLPNNGLWPPVQIDKAFVSPEKTPNPFFSPYSGRPLPYRPVPLFRHFFVCFFCQSPLPFTPWFGPCPNLVSLSDPLHPRLTATLSSVPWSFLIRLSTECFCGADGSRVLRLDPHPPVCPFFFCPMFPRTTPFFPLLASVCPCPCPSLLPAFFDFFSPTVTFSLSSGFPPGFHPFDHLHLRPFVLPCSLSSLDAPSKHSPWLILL